MRGWVRRGEVAQEIHHHAASLSLSPLTVLQDGNIGDVTLVCLVLGGDWGKLDVAGVEDGSQGAVNTAELLQQ